jgi:hypothetical protein
MAKLFNKTRKTIIKEGKTANYLKYAIGEIVLVVIGILIALQINNWNEKRKEHLTERILLTNLKEDLSRNKEIIQSNISGLNFILAKIDLLLTAHTENRAYNDSLNGYFHLARVFPESPISFVTFDEIKTKGTDIIESTDLRKKIVELFEITLSNMIETTNRLESALRPIQLEHQTKNFFSSDSLGSLIPNDGEKLMLDSEYFNIVSQRRLYYKMFTSMKENCIKEIDIVQNLIDQELIN